MATALRRGPGRSPVAGRGGAGGAKAARGAGGAAGHGVGGPSPWLIRVALAALGLAGCFLIVAWATPGGAAGSSSSSTARGAAASLMGHLTGGRKAQEKQKQELARLDTYCEAPLTGLEGPAHLPLPVPTTAKLRQLQVVIRHGDRSPINSLTTPPPRFSCKLRDPAMAGLARRMKEDGKDATFRIVGLGGTATRSYLTTALLPPEEDKGQEGEKKEAQQQACFPGQLTERGFRQQVANGRFLRERYAEALGPISDPGA